MNLALSHAGRPYGARRHPLGLTIVLVLHVLAAGELLTAHTLRRPALEPRAVDLLPEPTKPPPVRRVEAPSPPPNAPRMVYAEAPAFKVDVDPPPVAATSRDPADPPVGGRVDGGGEKVAVAEPARVTPRPAVLDANAAQCRPDYPAAAQRAGATGVSHLRFTIDASGRVVDARILRPSGPTREHHLLDQAAAAALARCPAAAGSDETGRAAASTADVEYVWTLN